MQLALVRLSQVAAIVGLTALLLTDLTAAVTSASYMSADLHQLAVGGLILLACVGVFLPLQRHMVREEVNAALGARFDDLHQEMTRLAGIAEQQITDARSEGHEIGYRDGRAAGFREGLLAAAAELPRQNERPDLRVAGHIGN